LNETGDKSRTIAETFVAEKGSGLPTQLQSEWTAAMTAALQAGFTAWPALAGDEVGCAVLEIIWSNNLETSSPGVEVENLHVADLTLAQSCCLGNAAAIHSFVTTYSPHIESDLLRLRIAKPTVEDLKQDILSKLVTVVPRKIGSYSGRALLRTWLRAVTTRDAMSLLRKRGETATDEKVLQALQDHHDASDPASEFVAKRYAQEFKSAFASAMQTLEASDRTLLRQYYVDSLSLEEIATLHHVHKTTVFRRIETARELLGKRATAAFRELVPINASEMQSIVRGLQSQVMLSLSRLTKE
jgi:RNA polymerase sigma-70 factor, ECF subfamily